MPDVSGNAALDVLIGLSFVFFLLSLVCSAVNEGIAQIFNLRAKNLKHGIRSLLADDETSLTSFYENWRVRALFKPGSRLLGGKVTISDRAPSYLPSRVFALTLLDTFAPPDEDTSSRDLIKRAKGTVNAISNTTVRGLVQDALDDARGDIDRFRLALERSFDEVMDRASGWYKRRVQVILFVIALSLVGAINADSFAIGERLWKDDAVRATVAAQAVAFAEDPGSATVCADNANPAERATECIDKVEQLGIPLGWTDDTIPNDTWSSIGKAFGLLVTAFALSLGAPFWFDLLSKVARLRATGPTETQPRDRDTPPAEPARRS